MKKVFPSVLIILMAILFPGRSALGDASRTWTEDVDSCTGGYSLTFTKHHTPGSYSDAYSGEYCYNAYGIEYCCHMVDDVEYCCHVDSHKIYKPYVGTPELEHCCHMELHDTGDIAGIIVVEHCTYFLNGLYEYYEVLDNGLTICWYIILPGGYPTRVCETRAPLENSGALSGQVTTADGKDVTAHIITYFSSGEKYKATDTKGSGPTKVYLIGSLEPTQFFIHAYAEGYETQVKSVSFNPGEEKVCNFTLVPSPPESKAMPWLLPLLLGD